MIERLAAKEPPRVRLANTPTRGHWLRYGERLGTKIWIKRDDHTGSELSGNKVRKLEYLMAEALQLQATHVITCGGEQSNHARATALAAAQLGLKCVLVLRTENPSQPPPTTANILLDRLAGAEIRWISRASWRERNQLMAQEADKVKAAGGKAYVIPEGGSNALGSWGYLRAATELVEDLAGIAGPDHPVTIVYACGSGGTGAGLVLGWKLLGLTALGIRVVGVAVCDDKSYFVDSIGKICGDFEERWQLDAHVTPADIEVLDAHVGLGYAKSRPEELQTIRDVCRSDGIVLDPVYTGKAFHGVVTELKANPKRFGAAVAFLHTGGMFGLFSSPDTFASVL